jgi:hypothetical protein
VQHQHAAHAAHGIHSVHATPADTTAPYIGFLIVVAVIVGLVILVRSINKDARKASTAEASAQSVVVSQWLDRVNRGALPEIHPVGIVPYPGERFFYEQRAQYGQTHTQRVYSGGNRALYIPLGHGFRARVGGNQGSARTVANFMWGAYGKVFVSNIRVAFKGDGSPDIATAPFDRILGYETHPDGLAIQTDHVGMMQFRTGDVILGTLFQKIIQQRAKPPADETAAHK